MSKNQSIALTFCTTVQIGLQELQKHKETQSCVSYRQKETVRMQEHRNSLGRNLKKLGVHCYVQLLKQGSGEAITAGWLSVMSGSAQTQGC